MKSANWPGMFARTPATSCEPTTWTAIYSSARSDRSSGANSEDGQRESGQKQGFAGPSPKLNACGATRPSPA